MKNDKKFKKKAELTMMQKIQSDQTVVLVSHSQHQIARLCDRAVLIENGISLKIGEPNSVLETYEKHLAME